MGATEASPFPPAFPSVYAPEKEGKRKTWKFELLNSDVFRTVSKI